MSLPASYLVVIGRIVVTGFLNDSVPFVGHDLLCFSRMGLSGGFCSNDRGGWSLWTPQSDVCISVFFCSDFLMDRSKCLWEEDEYLREYFVDSSLFLFIADPIFSIVFTLLRAIVQKFRASQFLTQRMSKWSINPVWCK